MICFTLLQLWRAQQKARIILTLHHRQLSDILTFINYKHQRLREREREYYIISGTYVPDNISKFKKGLTKLDRLASP